MIGKGILFLYDFHCCSLKKGYSVPDNKPIENSDIAPTSITPKVKFEIYGEEMIEKKVKASGNSGRVYLPPNWINHHVKIIRID